MAMPGYVPGNLIYANGNRFLPRYYHLDPQGVQDQVRLQVDIENQAVAEFGGNAETAGAGLGAQAIRAVPICDVDLPHQSHITDEEDYRFQLAVSVFGKEQDRHGEGKAFHWGSKQVSLRRSVHLRLVNVGPASKVQRGELGYPVCLVCGQSRSPLASQADQDNFRQEHAERCHQNVEATGFYADIVSKRKRPMGCIWRSDEGAHNKPSLSVEDDTFSRSVSARRRPDLRGYPRINAGVRATVSNR
jgi:hypothetical protein